VKVTKKELLELYSSEPGARNRGFCLDAETLALAAADELDKAERQRVVTHLAECADCAEEFKMIVPLKSWAEAAARGVTEPVAIPSFRPEVLAQHSRPRGWRARFGDLLVPARLAYAMAALFLILSVAIVFWAVSLQKERRTVAALLAEERAGREQAIAAAGDLESSKRELEERIRRYEQDGASRGKEEQISELRRTVNELSRSHANAPIINLEPQGSLRGQAQTSAKTIDLPPGINAYVLVLNVTGEQKHQRYALEIEDQKGAIVRREPGLQKSPYDTFTLVMTRGLLRPGEYHFRLYGTNGRRELVEDYTVLIRFR
jgi:hypothetical protein